MALLDQPLTTYSDTNIHKRIIGETINIIDPMDTPVIARLGLDSARSKFRLNLNGMKIEIIEDEYMPLSHAANQGTTITSTTTDITFADASKVKVGQVLKLDDEYVVVSAVNTTTNVVSVQGRGFGSTSAATHGATVTATVVGMARLEGADADYGGVTKLTTPYNYMAIFEEAVKVTGSQAAINQWGINDEYDYRLTKKKQELLRLVERMVFYGERVQGSASASRSFGGFDTFITDNSSSITTTITKASLDDLAELIYNDGGRPDLVILPPSAVNNLRSLIDSSSFMRVTQEETMFGMRPVTRINTQFFENLEIVVSRHCPTTKGWMLDSRKVGMFTLRPFKDENVARSGDYKAGEVIGEMSLLVANDKGHGYITTSNSEL
jgi:hypothetical protein